MRKSFLTTLAFFCFLLLLNACGDNDKFQVKGTIPGIGTQNLRIVYCSMGAIRSEIVTVVDDKFSFEGSSITPTIVEVFTSDRILLGRLIAENGDHLECVLDKSSPYKLSVKGNKDSQRWATFLGENEPIFATKDPIKINQLISKYVTSHKEDLVSTALIITDFYTTGQEETADSLLSIINPAAHPQDLVKGYESLLAKVCGQQTLDKITTMTFYTASDTINTVNPSRSSFSLFCFTLGDNPIREQVVKDLRNMREQYTTKRLALLDISLDSDTIIWKKTIKSDSATWVQCWAPGSIAAHQIQRLNISRIPFFIVADSTGKQLYRGLSFVDAEALINAQLK